MQNLYEYLDRIGRQGFYGSVELVYQDGQIVLVNELKKIKPADLA